MGAAIIISFLFKQLLPDDARVWGVLAFCALGLGFLLLGGVTLAAARRS